MSDDDEIWVKQAAADAHQPQSVASPFASLTLHSINALHITVVALEGNEGKRRGGEANHDRHHLTPSNHKRNDHAKRIDSLGVTNELVHSRVWSPLSLPMNQSQNMCKSMRINTCCHRASGCLKECNGKKPAKITTSHHFHQQQYPIEPYYFHHSFSLPCMHCPLSDLI